MEITNICPYCGGKMREGALPAYKYPLTWCPRNEQGGKSKVRRATMGFFNFFKRDISEEEFQEQQKVKRGLEKTRTGFFQSIVNTLTNAQIDDDLYDQLEIWADRAGVEIVRSREGADPGAVLFDSLQAAKARNVDVVFCDTAGRLHNKANLMQELAKLRKIIDRETPDAAKETLLVLDATTGQNGLQQAKVFRETAGLTGIILTKLDGTAKGGICVAIAQELGVPVKFVGLGEGIDDLQPFDAKEYVNALI